ncbi:MAG TPA: hypothetical protein VI386_04510 [Candidatus Sulfotelmatobacter sp.]
MLIFNGGTEQRGPHAVLGGHTFIALVSKDIVQFHFDFNVTQFLIGRSNTFGFDKSQQLNLAFSRVIRGGLQFTGEFYGETRFNRTTAGFASSLWALTYTVIPRLVVDGGFEVGLTPGGPHRHVFLGATCAIANLYSRRRRKR